MPDDLEWARDRERILREMIRHEDSLRDNRLGYLLTFNAFLFAGLAFAWKNSDALITVLALVGLAVGISAEAGQITSNKAVTKLRKLAEDADPPIVGLTSHETGEYQLSWWTRELAPWKTLPLILIVAWPTVLVVRWIT